MKEDHRKPILDLVREGRQLLERVERRIYSMPLEWSERSLSKAVQKIQSANLLIEDAELLEVVEWSPEQNEDASNSIIEHILGFIASHPYPAPCNIDVANSVTRAFKVRRAKILNILYKLVIAKFVKNVPVANSHASHYVITDLGREWLEARRTVLDSAVGQ